MTVLRQVLTPAELRELGFNVAAHDVPPPAKDLAIHRFFLVRSFLAKQFLAFWTSLGFVLFSDDHGDGHGNPEAGWSLLSFCIGFVCLLVFGEALLGRRLAIDPPSESFWDWLALILGLLNRMVIICDWFIWPVAAKLERPVVSGIVLLFCCIAYIGIVALQQLRIILSLFTMSDQYTLDHPVTPFFPEVLNFGSEGSNGVSTSSCGMMTTTSTESCTARVQSSYFPMLITWFRQQALSGCCLVRWWSRRRQQMITSSPERIWRRKRSGLLELRTQRGKGVELKKLPLDSMMKEDIPSFPDIRGTDDKTIDTTVTTTETHDVSHPDGRNGYCAIPIEQRRLTNKELSTGSKMCYINSSEQIATIPLRLNNDGNSDDSNGLNPFKHYPVVDLNLKTERGSLLTTCSSTVIPLVNDNSNFDTANNINDMFPLPSRGAPSIYIPSYTLMIQLFRYFLLFREFRCRVSRGIRKLITWAASTLQMNTNPSFLVDPHRQHHRGSDPLTVLQPLQQQHHDEGHAVEIPIANSDEFCRHNANMIVPEIVSDSLLIARRPLSVRWLTQFDEEQSTVFVQPQKILQLTNACQLLDSLCLQKCVTAGES